MSYGILFCGFRHSHINGLYKKVEESALFECVGCVEPNDDARKAAEETLGAKFLDKSYDEWLKEDFDIVAIGCAYGDRGQAVIKALEAGKHVIADKPICITLKEYKKYQLKQKNGKVIQLIIL